MKLKDYAEKVGVSYRTAWRWWKAGKLRGVQMDTGTILIEVDETVAKGKEAEPPGVALYGRVLSSENRDNLEKQMDRLRRYANAKGYVMVKEVKEIGSGLNDDRPKLEKLLVDRNTWIILVEHKDRLTRFGFRYIEKLLEMQGRQVVVINPPGSDRAD